MFTKLTFAEWKKWSATYVAEKRYNRERIGQAFLHDFRLPHNADLFYERNTGKATQMILETYVKWQVTELL